MKRLAIIFLGLLTALSAPCKADVIYSVTLNTAPLIGNANAPFALDFQLTSGDTATGVVNTATLSEFQFGIGGSAGTGNPFSNSGNASGALSSIVKLNTSGSVFFNEFSQYFTPGSKFTFQLDLSNHPQPTPTPDEFTFQLIDKTSNEVSTTDPSGSNSLLVIDLTGVALQPQVYTTNGDAIAIAAQIASVSAAPEPGTASLLMAAGALLAAIGRLRRTSRGLSKGKPERRIPFNFPARRPRDRCAWRANSVSKPPGRRT
jgi:hypothetical protein